MARALVFDTARSTLAQKSNAETDIGGSETPVLAEPQPSDAFAEMAAIRVRRVFDRFAPLDELRRGRASPTEKSAEFRNRPRMSTAARKGLTFNPLHKPPGRS
jgi:hypothetical protein